MSTEFRGACIAAWIERNRLTIHDTPRVDLRCAAKGCRLLLATIYLPRVVEDVVGIGKTLNRSWKNQEDEFYILRGYPGAIQIHACPKHTFVKDDDGTVSTADPKFHKRIKDEQTKWRDHEPAEPAPPHWPAHWGSEVIRSSAPMRTTSLWPIRCSDLGPTIQRARETRSKVDFPVSFTERRPVCEYCLKLPFPGCRTEHSTMHRTESGGWERRVVVLTPAQPCYCEHDS